jgi:hypothetical protein
MPYAISCEVSSTYPSLMLFCLISFKIETGATRYSCPCGARVQCWRSLSFEEFEGRYNSPRCFPNNVVACAALIIGNHANPLVYKSSARLVNTCYANTTVLVHKFLPPVRTRLPHNINTTTLHLHNYAATTPNFTRVRSKCAQRS